MGPIRVMWIRQMRRFWRSKPRLLIFVLQPVLFLIAFGFGFGPTFSKAGEGNYMLFLAPGIIGMTILFSAIFNGAEIIWDKQFGFLKETLAAPVSRTRLMLGWALGGSMVSVIQGFIVLIATFFVGFSLMNLQSVFYAFVVMFLIAMFFTSLGIAMGTLFDDMQAFPLIMNLFAMPLFFLSGALFPFDNFPRFLQVINYANPMMYGVDALRGVLTGNFMFHPAIDYSILFVLVVITIFVGAFLFERMEV